MPLLKNYVQFLVVFLGWVMLPHPRQQAQIMVGLGYPTFRVKILSERTKRMNEQYKNKIPSLLGVPLRIFTKYTVWSGSFF